MSLADSRDQASSLKAEPQQWAGRLCGMQCASHTRWDWPVAEYLERCIGAQIIFWDLRSDLLEGLYKHRVETARLQPILDCIDSQHLGALVEIAAPVRCVTTRPPPPLPTHTHLHCFCTVLCSVLQFNRVVIVPFWSVVCLIRQVLAVAHRSMVICRGCFRFWRGACCQRWSPHCAACTWTVGPHGARRFYRRVQQLLWFECALYTCCCHSPSSKAART